MFLAAAKIICFEDPPCFSPQPWLPTFAFPWWHGTLHLGWADKLQDQVSSQCAHRLPSHLWVPATFRHSCQLVLMSICHWWAFISASAIWEFLPVGSDVCLMLRTICEHWLLFGHFCQLVLNDVCLPLRTICEHEVPVGHSCQFVLTSLCCWAPYVSSECHLGILPVASEIRLPLRIICAGQVFVWDSVPVTLREGLW